MRATCPELIVIRDIIALIMLDDYKRLTHSADKTSWPVKCLSGRLGASHL
jgi:hypothetical protein